MMEAPPRSSACTASRLPVTTAKCSAVRPPKARWSMKRHACTCMSLTMTSRSGRAPSGVATTAESEQSRRRQSVWPPTAA
jgi:hypothetical protein